MLRGINQSVEDVIRDLSRLWDENQATVFSLLQDAMVKIAKNPHLEADITNAVKELGNVQRLDPKNIRIVVSGTSGEGAVETAQKGMWARLRSRLTGLLSYLTTSEVANPTGRLARLKQQFSRFRVPQSTPKDSAGVSVTREPLLPSGTSGEHLDRAVASSSLDPANPTRLAIAGRPASLAPEFLCPAPTTEGGGFAVNPDSPSKGRAKDKRTVKLTRKVLFNQILSTSFGPVISRVKTRAQSYMTESLIEMTALAHHAAIGALKECCDLTEKHMEANKPEDTKQLRADTLERLICWGNLVAAQVVIQEMKRLTDDPDAELTDDPDSQLTDDSDS